MSSTRIQTIFGCFCSLTDDDEAVFSATAIGAAMLRRISVVRKFLGTGLGGNMRYDPEQVFLRIGIRWRDVRVPQSGFRYLTLRSLGIGVT